MIPKHWKQGTNGWGGRSSNQIFVEETSTNITNCYRAVKAAAVRLRETFHQSLTGKVKTVHLVPCLASSNVAVSAVWMTSWLLTLGGKASQWQFALWIENPSRFNGSYYEIIRSRLGLGLLETTEGRTSNANSIPTLAQTKDLPAKIREPTLPLKLFLVSESVSGAMKAGVPAVLDSKASLPSNWLLTPKSAIFTCPSSPSSRLEGLMSRWTIFW